MPKNTYKEVFIDALIWALAFAIIGISVVVVVRVLTNILNKDNLGLATEVKKAVVAGQYAKVIPFQESD